MKTKEQIIDHLLTVGYTEQATDKIMGFLIGSGVKEAEEVIKYRKGLHDWEEFWKWFNSNENTFKAVDLVDSLIDDVTIASVIGDCCLLSKKLNFLYDLREELLKDES